MPRFIRAEANLLRLPLFALQTKGLKTLDGIECSGTVTRNGETHNYTLIAARSTITPYPGPMARAAHLAFLSIATERGFPIENPITWSWRELCRRMGIGGSGKNIANLKAAIESTAALFIKSHYAIYSKPGDRMICTQEEALHLYERTVFVGSSLPDGSIADKNHLWLADWYLQNLNAMFTAPLDYELWQHLNQKSPIASRLYEFLFLNFYSGTPVFRINYEKLAKLLPVRPERYRSQAKQQLDPALHWLKLANIIEDAIWTDSKSGLALLHIHRGKGLTAPRDQAQLPFQFMEEEFEGSIEVKELRKLKPPEWTIVTDFYRLWEGNEQHRPTKKELEQAKQLFEQHGPKKAKDLIARVVKRMKKQWPDAKTFGAITRYIGDASADYDREQRRVEQEQREQLRRQKEREETARRDAEEAQFVAAWRPVWESLPEAQREEIRQVALSGPNWFLKKVPRLAEKVCLEELARRQGATVAPPPPVAS